MKEITEDYCNFETAKLLKEKGMNKSCFKHYVQKNNNDGTSEAVTVCTLQMAMKWLREQHSLFIQITVDFSDGAYPMYNVYVVNLAICISIIVNRYNRYSYKEAVEAAIKYCLEKLI